MSESRIAPQPPPTPENALDELLFAVEDRCNRAVAVLHVAARAVEGDDVGLDDESVPSVFGAALEHIAEELTALSNRALAARVARSG